VRAELRSRIPDVAIMTTGEFKTVSYDYMLYEGGLIGVLAMGLLIGTTVGLAIVILAVLSSVQQNLREFATLKAIGATNADLRRIVFFQSVSYTIAGSFIGASLLCELAWAARSPHLILMLSPVLLLGLVPYVGMIAIVAAALAIRKVQKVDPASVFQS
jgi:putative ABC transport system permease protein